MEATKAPRQLPRRQSTHQRDVVKERRQALATNKAAVPPTAPAIARPSINAEMPAKEIPKMPPLIKISTVNPPAPVNTNLSVIPNFYNERYSEPTKLSSNVLVNGVPEIGMKTFNRVAHKEKSSSSSEVEKSVNSTEAIKNHPSNNSHTSSPAHPEPEPSTSHGRNIRRTFPKVLPTSHQALKSILKATNRSRRSIKRNIAFKQDLCVVHEREPTEEEIAAWKLELQTHDRVPCLDIGLEQNFPNIYRAAVLLAENKILPRVDNQLIEEPPIIHNMRTCYDKYEIVDFRE